MDNTPKVFPDEAPSCNLQCIIEITELFSCLNSFGQIF